MHRTIEVTTEGAILNAQLTANASASGLPLVFLHAGVADLRMWQAQCEGFADRHPVLAYDRRGFGASRITAAVPHARVADLWAVMDAAGLKRAVLVGCSQGGRVALDAALEQPQRVAGLVLVAPAVTGAPDAELSGAVKVLGDAIDAASAAGDLARVNELEAQLWLDGPDSAPGRVSGAVRELFLAMNQIALHAPDPGPVVDAPSAWTRIEQVEAPALLVWGDLDLPHLRSRCELLATRLPQVQRVVMEGTAHLPGLESPARFNALLRDWLSA
ncbi:MAG TPA: alpha/beta hydrolase [Albitalea sp.]|uniref:alpha/beta fold hydrolase n=1 Tax=Piscinibacter sp. TaxID=1903157 RepID=UPI002ED4DF26